VKANIPKRIQSKYFRKIVKTLIPILEVLFSCGLANCWTSIFNFAPDNFGWKLGIEILYDIIESNIITIVFPQNMIFELVDFP
jgi:hypothetical protein